MDAGHLQTVGGEPLVDWSAQGKGLRDYDLVGAGFKPALSL